ncbi:sporulation protein [Streptomyces sp. NPDC059979]|uniref:sporulation protein n=1 Tax=Streptomyces sp. NPDC059979 TaxID=3347021 RepID=UPI0036ABC0CC
MAHAKHRRGEPNEDLARLIGEARASHKSLAARINQIGEAAGVALRYEHTSVARWVNLGMVPRGRVPEFLAAALGERLGRQVTVEDIGMFTGNRDTATMGLDFPRDPADAVRVAATYWRTVDRRNFLSNGFALASFTTPVTRWLTKPADDVPAHQGTQRVGRADLDELWAASQEARLWDSRLGGGNWRTSSVTQCLKTKAAPMLLGTYSQAIGKELFAATAELSRVVGWAAFDVGHHEVAQRHFVQALRLARAAGDVETGCYVLTTMALQTFLRGYPEQAADMAEGAYERARGHAAPRVLAFAKLAEARAHGRAHNAQAAGAALAQSERLLDSIRPGAHDPERLSYFTPARLATDAIEIHRDLAQPKAALRWNKLAEPMPAGQFTRATGIRLAVLASSHLQNGDLDRGLSAGTQALKVLRSVNSTRARSYLHNVATDLTPWRTDNRVKEFTHRARTELPLSGMASGQRLP